MKLVWFATLAIALTQSVNAIHMQDLESLEVETPMMAAQVDAEQLQGA